MPDITKELEVRVKFISDVKKLAIPESNKASDALEKFNKGLKETLKIYKELSDKSPWAKEATAIEKATTALSKYNAELARSQAYEAASGGGGYMGGGMGGGGGRSARKGGGRGAAALGFLGGIGSPMTVQSFAGMAGKFKGMNFDSSGMGTVDRISNRIGNAQMMLPMLGGAGLAAAGVLGSISALRGPTNSTPVQQRESADSVRASLDKGLGGLWVNRGRGGPNIAQGIQQSTAEWLAAGKGFQSYAAPGAATNDRVDAMAQRLAERRQRQTDRIGEEASFRMSAVAYDSPGRRSEVAAQLVNEMGEKAGDTSISDEKRIAYLKAQMEAVKELKSAGDDINKAKAEELDKEGKIVEEHRRKVDLLKQQVDRAKELNNATAAAAGKATSSEIKRAEKIVEKIKSGGELTGREADFLGSKFGPAGSKIADEARQKMGREKAGGLISDLDKLAGIDSGGKQKEYDEAKKKYTESKSQYDEHMKEFQSNMKKFTEDITKTFQDVNKALVKAMEDLTKQSDNEKYNIPVN